ncbi:hypothetical protein HMPREF0290_0180 [Corynebacterium efficiens YS-314]|uniref:DUF421 domain-containing protein n=1 Tax=Corynebacterium efficiens (strain DSM 44549 / YS-314 / AJ 12310 / JCM 11189 / NBRC 100395) TaxID=196164 RepID=Q8FM21_COREF|nr:YetF domain-containing protein [Corynebacterium efficiens]EEW51220.1 hypothetical protein HMPREF0290_0180 [Corynebacterium efficiens YS-314]BAC19496.1 conserved hypothetical protein [Corynebacterium efficiens YS-314]
MWFDSWDDVVRIVLVGAASYTALVILLRLAGKRTLSQLNVFDFVVTVALGSILASVLLDSTLSLAEGITALALLGGLQFSVASISSRWPGTRTIITGDPELLLANGKIRHEAMHRNRLTESEIRQAVRASGGGDLSQIRAVVLESNGKISVITDSQFSNGSALQDVHGREDL